MELNNNQQAFFALVRAGLWENLPVHGEGFKVLGQAKRQSRANDSSDVDWGEVYQLAEEQSVIGVVLAGIEHSNVKPPQELLLQWIGEVQMLEQQNKAMNLFVADLIDFLRKKDIYTILVKGQGIAQCYERPLWRASGDIDLLLSDTNYEKAKKVLLPLAIEVDKEYKSLKHLGLTMDGGYVVELHGTLYSRLSKRVDRIIDEAQNDVFFGGNVRSWHNGSTQVFLPSVDNDVIFVFTHILHHFYIDGVGIRQICDWCRLLWTYRDSLDHELLESRIREMGLMNVWRGFAAFAVDYLGMPKEAMPFYQEGASWDKKAGRICSFILEVGGFGCNRDNSYYRRNTRLIRKAFSFRRKCGDMLRHIKIFPLETFRFFPYMVYGGLAAVARGE